MFITFSRAQWRRRRWKCSCPEILPGYVVVDECKCVIMFVACKRLSFVEAKLSPLRKLSSMKIIQPFHVELSFKCCLGLDCTVVLLQPDLKVFFAFLFCSVFLVFLCFFIIIFLFFILIFLLLLPPPPPPPQRTL